MGKLRLPFAVLRQVYGRMGAIAWLLAVAVAARIVLTICIAL